MPTPIAPILGAVPAITPDTSGASTATPAASPAAATPSTSTSDSNTPTTLTAPSGSTANGSFGVQPSAPAAIQPTPLPKTIDSTNLNQPTVTVPTPTVNSTTAPVTPTTNNLAEDAIKNAPVADTAAETQAKSITASLNALVPSLQGQTGDLYTQEDALGYSQDVKDLQNYNNQIKTLQAALDSGDTSLIAAQTQQGALRGLLPFVQDSQAKLASDQAINKALLTSQIGVLNAQVLATQGNMSTAQTLAQRAVDMKYAPITDQINTYKSQLDALAPILTVDEAHQATAIDAQNAVKLQQINAETQNQKDAIANITTAITNGTVDAKTGYQTIADMVGGKVDTAGAYQELGINQDGTISSTAPGTAGSSGKGIVGNYDLSSYATDPAHTTKVLNIYNKIGTNDVSTAAGAQAVINQLYPNSPVTGAMIQSAATQYGVDPKVLISLMGEETQLGTDGSVGAKGNNFGNVGNTDALVASGKSVSNNTPQDGVNSTAQWLAAHPASNTSTSDSQNGYSAYGLLATNTNFNPQNVNDVRAQNYLKVLFSTGQVPTPLDVLGQRTVANPNIWTGIQARAADLYKQATGTSLSGVNLLQLTNSNKLVSGNDTLLNSLDIQKSTIGQNFALAVKNLTANNINQNIQPINDFLDTMKNIFGDPNIAQYLAQNATIGNEVGSLLSLKNSSGTTVHDKLESAGLINNNMSAGQEVSVVKTLLAEATNASDVIKKQNASLYTQIDPLEQGANAQPDKGIQTPDDDLKAVQAFYAASPTNATLVDSLHAQYPNLTITQVRAALGQ